MPDPVASVDDAMRALEHLRGRLRRSASAQVRSREELGLIEATAYAWFQTHRVDLEGLTQSDRLGVVDDGFRVLLQYAGRATAREKYKAQCKVLRASLVDLRSHILDPAVFGPDEDNDDDFSQPPPDFATLVPDPAMQVILNRRWEETKACLRADAHLAATVMMGSLLEALLLARILRMPNLQNVFTAQAAPRDRQGKTKPLSDWTLRHYIEVGHELGWVSQSGKDVGAVLRDYRNYIHPHKELSHGVTLSGDDTSMFWKIFTSLAGQVLRSV